MDNAWDRTARLIGKDKVERLGQMRVAVFGLGGVGSFVAEALARSGVGALDLIDKDTVDETNLNRQLFATRDTVGRPKVEAAAERIASIAPDCAVRTYQLLFLPDTADTFDFSAFDYVADAIDNVTAKMELIRRCDACGTPIISAMGAGNKLDPTRFEVADIYRTEGCPLARTVRKLCRESGVQKLKVVYSKEPPVCEPMPSDGERPPIGSVPFVPSVAGLILASEIVRDLIK